MAGVRIAGLITASALLLVATSPQRGDAISCYQCNSAYDPRCGDPFDDYSLAYVNCSMQQVPEHLRPMNVSAVICRKNVQKVYGKIRVVRGCGYIVDSSMSDGNSCVHRSGTHDVHVQYCACNGEKCNGAPSLQLSPPALAAALLLLLPPAVVANAASIL